MSLLVSLSVDASVSLQYRKAGCKDSTWTNYRQRNLLLGTFVFVASSTLLFGPPS